MRTLALNQTAGFNSGTFYHGARNEGWRLWDGRLKAINDDTGSATVTLTSAVTGEVIATLSLTGNDAKRSGVIQIPAAYYCDISGVTEPVKVTVKIDGDTGNAVGNRPEVQGGFDNGFDQGFG